MITLRPVRLDFLEAAPARFDVLEPVAAPPDRVFAAIAADPSTWTWFPGIDEGAYESAPPHGVGSIRAVRMGEWTYRETMLAWDAPHRWAYRVDETTAPLFRALAEDWRVEPDGRGALVRWRFAFDPDPGGGIEPEAIREASAAVFASAMEGLSAHLAQD